jgi:two-component system response regulator RpaA
MMDKTIFSIVQIAKICGVAPRTVCKWFDSGRLRGYRAPGSPDRRIPREFLIKFMVEHRMPLPAEFRQGQPDMLEGVAVLAED